MKSWTKPTSEAVSRAVGFIGRPAQYRYFFDQLENPEWIDPLRDRGFFSSIPEGTADSETGTISFPLWPESGYLARMASHVPERVAAIMAEWETDNPRVLSDILDAALQMPPSILAKFKPQIRGVLQAPYQPFDFAEKTVALIRKLTEVDRCDDAVVLARELLRFEEPRRRTGFVDEPELRGRWLREEEIFDVLKQALTERCADEGLDFFVSSLSAYLRLWNRLQAPEESQGVDRYSYSWRSAIENHVQNEPRGLRDYLVEAVRDVAQAVIATDPSRLRKVVECLDRQKYKVFGRIALHLLAETADADIDLVSRKLLDPELRETLSYHHEYYRLLERHFGRLRAENQNTVVKWLIKSDGDDAREMSGARLLRALYPIRAHLQGGLKEQFQRLMAEYGEPEHPDLLTWSSGVSSVPFRSPKSAEDLIQLGPAGMVDFVATWTPEQGFDAPDEPGLSGELEAAVAQDARRFAKGHQQLRRLPLVYQGAVLRGFAQAQRESTAGFPWLEVLKFALWALTGGPGEDLSSETLRRREWLRLDVARLLSAGFSEGPGEMPFPLRQLVWLTLEHLVRSAAPTTPSVSGDPFQQSLNHSTGRSLQALVEYALWVRRLKAGGDRDGFASMPEAQAALEFQLKSRDGDDAAIMAYAVIGRSFPWLTLIDPRWSTAAAPKIFPVGEASPTREQQAAWNSYVRYSGAYDSVYPILKPAYRAAIDRLSEPRPPERRNERSDPHVNLGRHLMALYWRGVLTGEEEMLRSFFTNAPAKVRKSAIAFLGRSLIDAGDRVTAEVRDRLKELWEWRLEEIRSEETTDAGAEISAFFYWVRSENLSADWLLRHLRRALEVALPEAQDVFLIIDPLRKFVGTHPVEVAGILETLVRSDKSGWGILADRRGLRELLEAIIRSGEPTAISHAQRTIDNLGRQYRLEFRDLAGKLPR